MNDLHYRIKGSGPALVLLHGFMESREIWNHFLPALTRNFSVVMIDLPGHGRSNNTDNVHTMPVMAQAVKQILDKENIQNCTMAGHSMGGYVTLAFARLFPELLNGLVLLHSHPDEDDAETIKNRDRSIEIVRKNKGSFISSFIPSLYHEPNQEKFKEEINRQIEIASSMAPEGIIAAQEGMKQRESFVDLLEKISIPVFFIIGKKDARANLPALLEHIGRPSHSEAMLLDNVGHMGFLEASNEVLSSLQHFAIKCSGV